MTERIPPPDPHLTASFLRTALMLVLMVGALVSTAAGHTGIAWALLAVQMSILAVQSLLSLRFELASRRWRRQLDRPGDAR